MLDSLKIIEKVKNGELQILKKEKWIRYLVLTNENNINLERISSFKEINENYLLNYVEKSLKYLSNYKLTPLQLHIVEETLKWSEVAKAGLMNIRRDWLKKGYNLYVHNIGSSQIYLQENSEQDYSTRFLISQLILTHGLIGQYIRGEVCLKENEPLYSLIQKKLISKEELKKILIVLNLCIINAADNSIWIRIKDEVEDIIDVIIEGNFHMEYSPREKLKRLRSEAIKNGEDFEGEYKKIFSFEGVEENINKLLQKVDLWYVEAALYDFSFEEFIKIFLIISTSPNIKAVKHISFDRFMKEIYYEHNGKKKINIYKKRVVEKYLSEITIQEILNCEYKQNMHVVHEVLINNESDDTAFFNFIFSKAASKLIDFCVEAEKSDVLYEKAIILLFD